MSKTGIFTVAICIVAALYDAVVVLKGGADASISRFLQDTAFASPLVTFVCGFLAGHWFGYMKPRCQKCKE